MGFGEDFNYRNKRLEKNCEYGTIERGCFCDVRKGLLFERTDLFMIRDRFGEEDREDKRGKRSLPPILTHAITGTRWALMAVLPALAFVLMEFYEHNPLVEVRELARWYNILLFELIAWILFFVTGRAKWALRILWMFAMVFGLVNHYVMEFRSTPFVPWDLFSVRTAASVAGNYDFTPEPQVISVTALFLAGIVLFTFMDLRLSEVGAWRLLPALVLVLVLGSFVSRLQDEDFQTSHQLYPFLFTPAYMTKVNGMAVTFAMDLAFLVVEKPSGYRAAEQAEILEPYRAKAEREKKDAKEEGRQLPNIIVIMDEAFSDLGVLGESFQTNVDGMPFVHKLQSGYENTITGMLHVSVCGGNTANTEFEFLTGNSMAFFPVGSIPYQQYVKTEIPSLASHLKSLGYSTCAIHPYNASGWSRSTVYPLLGFDEFYSLKDFASPQLLHSYVSDASDFEKVIELYERREEGRPLFLFNVTMQNHGSYTDAYDNFTADVTANTEKNFALEQYLSLIRRSDEAFEKLVRYFEEQEEPTVIVFFGDHQPADSVVRPVWEANGVNDKALTKEQEQLRYEVPYVIWSNTELASASGRETSVNYLAEQVLSAAGVPRSDYQCFLEQLATELPLISAIRREGSEEAVASYQKLQYYQMFDREETGLVESTSD